MKIFLLSALLLSTAVTAAAQDTVYGTAERPDPAREAVAVNTTPSGECQPKVLEYLRAASVAVTGSGRIWSAMLGGEGADACILLSYSDTQGKKWSPVVGVVDAQDASLPEKRSAYSPVLWSDPDGRLWLFYTVSMGYFDGRGSLWATVCDNPGDAAPVWGAPQYVGVGTCSGKPQVLADGGWVLPMALWGRDVINYHAATLSKPVGEGHRISSPCADAWHELDDMRGAGTYISPDKGHSWSYGSRVTVPEKVKARYNDPQLIFRSSGELVMYTRSCGSGWCHYTVSKDNSGKEWYSPGKLVLHSDAKVSITRLADGRWLMLRNGRFDQTIYALGAGIYAYLSEDDGATWYGGLCVDSRKEATIADVVQAADGTIYALCSYKPAAAGEVVLATLTAGEIDAATADPAAVASQVKCVIKAGKAAAKEAAEMKALNASKKNWQQKTMRIATYNIQHPNTNPTWKGGRLPAMRAQWDMFDFDIVGTQEPFLGQVNDIMEFAGDRYDWIGWTVKNDNTTANTHFNAIFYRKERFEVVDWDIVWYTEKPTTPGYGAYSSRMCVWARFRDKECGQEFYLFNSHFDHIDPEGKLMASYILADAVRRIAKGMPAFMTGDFNSDENSAPYKALLESGFINDTLLAVSEPVNAEYFSMANYSVSKLKKTNRHIDHIFYTFANTRVYNWHMYIDDYYGNFGSDHLPIVAEVKVAN